MTTAASSPRLAARDGRRGQLHRRLSASVEQVAEALLAYVRVGASTLLIRGYDPYDDAVAYGDLVTAVREGVEREGLDPAGAALALAS